MGLNYNYYFTFNYITFTLKIKRSSPLITNIHSILAPPRGFKRAEMKNFDDDDKK